MKTKKLDDVNLTPKEVFNRLNLMKRKVMHKIFGQAKNINLCNDVEYFKDKLKSGGCELPAGYKLNNEVTK